MLGNKTNIVFNPDQLTGGGGGAWGCTFWRKKMLTYVVNVNTYTQEINQTYNSFSLSCVFLFAKELLNDCLIIDILNKWLCMLFRKISHSFLITINFRTRGTCTLSRFQNPVASKRKYICFKWQTFL